MSALLLPLLLVAVGGALDFIRAFNEKEQLQSEIDSAMLLAAKAEGADAQFEAAKSMLATKTGEDIDIEELLNVSQNSDGSVTGTFDASVKTYFLQLVGIETLPITVSATAIASGGSNAGGGCIYVLGSKGQDVLINSGANVHSDACEVHVQSKASPAFIMNSGSKIETARFCVRGTNYIKNGGTLTNLEVGCIPDCDPYEGELTEPTVQSTCTTSGWKDGTSHTLKPGVHCETGFNGSPTITFEPGLHIIKGRMIINSNATVIAKGVTFYFPDVSSEIRINGGVTFTGAAPTSGTYKGILMFEKTSDATNNANKQQYIFNGSNGEVLEGIIYLPNRDVTYNSTTNQVSRISLVVNTMIMNSSNWLIEPYTGGSDSAASGTGVRLVK
ncbi:pilus assembly protein TadG-related protein [Sinorhizobium sp. BG8]|uniref:pilus assembly protein TadG-related protein n=1 Tax=Sinorhizobium sp. BG8 TaxID=2613773 RepID=UPI001FEF0CC1|nr:pilus assembly protein TadG-related protein [Sinorhizobium sp. BG8]